MATKIPDPRPVIEELKTAFQEIALENIQGGKLKPLGEKFVRYAGATIAISCFYGLLAAFAVKGVWGYFRGREAKRKDAALNEQIRGTFQQVSQLSRQMADMQMTLNTLKETRPAPAAVMPPRQPVAPGAAFPAVQNYYAPPYAYPQYAMGRPYW